MRRKLSQKLDIEMVMTTMLNSALYCDTIDHTNADLHKDNARPANILYTVLTTKMQIISEESHPNDKH
jgi:hypothetical protein